MIYLVRHGQTAFNLEQRHHGHTDSPLTRLGREQARLAGNTLLTLVDPQNSVVFTSPLGRTLQTAEIIWRVARITAPIVIDPDLMEIGMGSAEGMTEAEMRERWPGAKTASAHESMTLQSPDGESLEALTKRLRRALGRVARHNAASRIIVSHGVSGRVLRALHLGLSSADVYRLDAPQDALFCLNDIGVTRYSISRTKSPLKARTS